MILKNNESGNVAYGWFMIVAYLIMAGLLWLAWSQVVDTILAVAINPMIADGEMSLQTANAIGWGVNFIRYCIPVILLAIFMFSVNYAIVTSGGGGYDPGAMWMGILAFFICTMAGILLAFGGGLLIDQLHAASSDLPYENSPTAVAMRGDLYFFINLFFFVCYCCPVLGTVLMFQSVVRRERGSAYTGGAGW